jgi:hypothetical protein
MSTGDWIALGSAVATFLGVLVAIGAIIYQGRKITHQLVLQNFSEYTKRYQEIILKFPEDINEPTFKLEGRSDYNTTMRALRAYFDLSYEEWYLNKRGFVDEGIWAVWEGGMKTALDKPAFRQAWHKIRSDTQFGVEFENFLDPKMAGK